jgi:hypothetical protein
LTTAFGTEFGAFVASSFDDESMIASPKSVNFCDRFSDLQQFRAREFDQFPAFCAVQMVMLGVPVVVFVDTATVQFETIQQAGIDELAQGSIDSWSGDIVRGALGRELFHQLIGVKMFVAIENLFD